MLVRPSVSICNDLMAQKQTVSFRMHPDLLGQFQQAAEAFQGKVGACFAAACLQWMETDPQVQADYLKKLYEAELREDVARAVEQAKSEQLKRIKSREDAPKPKRGS